MYLGSRLNDDKPRKLLQLAGIRLFEIASTLIFLLNRLAMLGNFEPIRRETGASALHVARNFRNIGSNPLFHLIHTTT